MSNIQTRVQTMTTTTDSIHELSDLELLTAALQSGVSEPQASVAQEILNELGEFGELNWTVLKKFGVSTSKATTILTVKELVNRSNY